MIVFPVGSLNSKKMISILYRQTAHTLVQNIFQ